MTRQPTHPPDSPEDDQQHGIATPEGDNEFAPGQPLTPIEAPERPRGDDPHSVEPLYPALDPEPRNPSQQT